MQPTGDSPYNLLQQVNATLAKSCQPFVAWRLEWVSGEVDRLLPDGVLESVVRQAGMNPGMLEEIDVPWTYPDEATLLRGLMSPAPIIRASQVLGDAVVRETLLQAVNPFKTATGSFVFKNKARYMIVKV